MLINPFQTVIHPFLWLNVPPPVAKTGTAALATTTATASPEKDAVNLGASRPTTVTVIGSTSWPGRQSRNSLSRPSAFVDTNQNTGASTAASTSSTAFQYYY